MPLDLRALVGNAVPVATSAGAASTLTITRPVVPNPLTGTTSGSPVVQEVKHVFPTTARKIGKGNDAAWSSARVVLFVAAAHVTWPPKRGDQCTWGGITAPIAALDQYEPNGVAIGWYVAVGGA
ncbi:MAG: hypothetical protein K2Y26_00200 [Gemmatimonadaceae bacterium]|nr:hypothetical protein [Gemmatimonadaceae bacterium]